MSKGTTKRGIRMDNEMWAQVQAQAEAEGVTVSERIRQLLRGWLNKDWEKQDA